MRDLGGCCRVRVQTRTPQHPLLSRAGFMGYSQLPSPLPSLGTPQEVSPFSGFAKQRGRSLIFPADPAMWGCRDLGFGCHGRLFALGRIHSLLFPGPAPPRPGRMVCCNFGCFWPRRDRAGRGGTRFNPGAAGSTLETGFSGCLALCQHQTPAVPKHPDISSRASSNCLGGN